MLVNGFSWACFLVQLVPQLVQIIRDEGIPDNSATSAVVASIFNFMFLLGVCAVYNYLITFHSAPFILLISATIGPTLAGILDEHIGFQWTMVAVILIAFTLLEETEVGSRIKSYSSDGEEELMLDSKHKQENGYYRSLDG
ncbi:hypothetical protein OS493_038490 [Desmophyllum pertusum]|uniref:Uncharacterized protein n=1 Tax=Desmophyllum pertusum TaxID=174260 RepID=A0A9W9YHK0_9CNID|nr:hypothetical protein OS493_038490 [Desmophyllum pertusum]